LPEGNWENAWKKWREAAAAGQCSPPHNHEPQILTGGLVKRLSGLNNVSVFGFAFARG